MLLFLESSLVIGIGCECKQPEKYQGSLHVIDEVNVVIILALVNCSLRLNSINCEWKDGVSGLSISDLIVELFVAVSALDVGHLVAPPHDCLPFRLIIFKEYLVVVWVFSKSDHNVFWISSLRPLLRLWKANTFKVCKISKIALSSVAVLFK